MSDAPDDKVTIYYLIGATRSGTTLLSRLLQLEERHLALGEVLDVGSEDVWEHPCGCGEAHLCCPFWEPRIQELRSHSLKSWSAVRSAKQIDQIAYFALPSRRPARLKQGIDFLPRLYRSFGGTGSVLVDESKLPWYGFVLATQPWSDVRFIELVRRPDEVVDSWRRAKSYHPSYPPEDVAKYWLRTHLTAAVVRRRSGRPWLRLPFTQLVDDPYGTLETILGRAPKSLYRADGRWTFESVDNHIYLSNADKLQRGQQVIRTVKESTPELTASGPWQRVARLYWERQLAGRIHLEQRWSSER